MANLRRGTMLVSFLEARVMLPLSVLEKEALETPDYLLRRPHLLYAAAARFSAPAGHALAAYWRASKESFADEIAEWWEQVIDWLPLNVKEPASIFAKFYLAQRMEYAESQPGAAYKLYLEISHLHPLAAARCAALGQSGQRLEGWRRYTGPTTRAVVSLQCFAIYLELMQVSMDPNSVPGGRGVTPSTYADSMQAYLSLRLSVFLGYAPAADFCADARDCNVPFHPEVVLQKFAAKQNLSAFASVVRSYINTQGTQASFQGVTDAELLLAVSPSHKALFAQEGWTVGDSVCVNSWFICSGLWPGLFSSAPLHKLIQPPVSHADVRITFSPPRVHYRHLSVPLHFATSSVPKQQPPSLQASSNEGIAYANVVDDYADPIDPASNSAAIYANVAALPNHIPTALSPPLPAAASMTLTAAASLQSAFITADIFQPLLFIDSICSSGFSHRLLREPRDNADIIPPNLGTYITCPYMQLLWVHYARSIRTAETGWRSKSFVCSHCKEDAKCCYSDVGGVTLCELCGLTHLFRHPEQFLQSVLPLYWGWSSPVWLLPSFARIMTQFYRGTSENLLPNKDTLSRQFWQELVVCFGPTSDQRIWHRAIWLCCQPWFHGFLRTDDAAALVASRRAGSWLLRFSTSECGLALTTIDVRGKVTHYRISREITADGEVADYILRMKPENRSRSLAGILVAASRELSLVEPVVGSKLYASVMETCKDDIEAFLKFKQ